MATTHVAVHIKRENMDLINFDTSRNLEELESAGSSKRGSMISRSSKLRQKRLKDLTTEELRMMIVQNRSLKYLVPLAIERLIKDPLLKGDLYPGDLTNALLTIERKFWVSDLNGYIPMFKSIIEKAQVIAESKPDEYKKFSEDFLQAINIFKANIVAL